MRLIIIVSLGTYLSPFVNGTRNLYKKAAHAAAVVAASCFFFVSFWHLWVVGVCVVYVQRNENG